MQYPETVTRASAYAAQCREVEAIFGPPADTVDVHRWTLECQECGQAIATRWYWGSYEFALAQYHSVISRSETVWDRAAHCAECAEDDSSS